MTLDALAALLPPSRLLPRRAGVDALKIVPELADGLPAVRTDPSPVVWSACRDAVRSAVAAALPGILTAGKAGDDEARLANDPLVGLLAKLVAEGAGFTPGAAVVPILDLLRAVSTDPQIDGLQARGAPPEPLARVAAEVQARIAAACTRAATQISGPGRVPALAWALANDRLAPIFPRGTLDRDPAWGRVAAVLGVPLPEGIREAVEAAVRLVVRGVSERRAAGKTTADDAILLLGALAPPRLDGNPDATAEEILADPDALAAILPALGRLIDAKALTAAKVDASLAARMLTVEGGLAVASACGEVLRALRTWDIHSRIVASVTASPVPALTVPRGELTRATVVAVGFGRQSTTASRAGGVAAAWRQVASTVPGGVLADAGVAMLAAFADPVDAFRFALEVGRRVEGSAVGIGHNSLIGGTDGAHVQLWGPAVEIALQWVSTGPLPTRASRPTNVVSLVSDGGWLRGTGIAIDAAAAEALREAQVRRGLATAVDGPPAGDARTPRSLDLHRIFELDGDVVAFTRIPGVAGGFEVLRMSVAAWRAQLDRDVERVEEPPPPSRVMSPVVVLPEPAVAEEPDSWEMADGDEAIEAAPFTLDLAESPAAVTPPSAEPRFDFHEPDTGDEALAASDDFSGFYLPGAAAEASEEPPAPSPAPSAAFDMEIEDEDDDEAEEWVPHSQPVTAPSRPPELTTFEPAPSNPFTVPDDAFGDPFGDDPFGDTPAEGGDRSDPFAADPFASASSPAESKPASDPFASDSGPFSVGDAFPEDPFASGDPFGADATTPTGPTPASRPRVAASADPFASDPFAEDEVPVVSVTPQPGARPVAPAATAPRPAPAPARPAPAPDPLVGDPDDPFGDPFGSPTNPVRPPTGRALSPDEESTSVFGFSEIREEGEIISDGPTGGRGERVGDSPSVVRRRSEALRAGSLDFDFLLKGYACFFERREAVFGRPYGTRIVDRHVYAYAGDADEAYTLFLRDKIKEGFVPRADLMGDLPRGVTLMPLDNEKLQRAWQSLA